MLCQLSDTVEIMCWLVQPKIILDDVRAIKK